MIANGICKTCGKSLRASQFFYCSFQCRSHGKAPTRPILEAKPCEHCGGDIPIVPGVSRHAYLKRKYCSEACRRAKVNQRKHGIREADRKPMPKVSANIATSSLRARVNELIQVQVKKERRCISCGTMFQSASAGNRICCVCRSRGIHSHPPALLFKEHICLEKRYR
jgi:hypothetical protein